MRFSRIGWTGLVAAGLWACGPKSGSGKDGGNTSSGGGPASCTLPATITSDMELTTACPVWHVGSSGTTVAGNGNPMLKIDPGVTVAVDKGGFLSAGTSAPGGIQAVGVPGKLITFTSSAAIPAPGDWAGVALGDQTLATSTIAFAKFDFASGLAGSGGQTSNEDGYSYDEPAGALIVYGGTGSVSLVLHDLEFANNAGNGLVYDNFKAGFATGSGNLKVDDVGTGYEPFVIAANQASTLPVTISGPAGTAVDLINGQGGSTGSGGGTAGVALTQTWPSIPLPYLADGSVVGAGNGIQIEGAGQSTATLTIAAPNTIEFKSGGSLDLDPNGSGQAVLLAIGTPTAPIVFTSASANPVTGAWSGFTLNTPSSGGNQLGSTQLIGVTIDWAGDGSISYAADKGVIGIASGAASDGPVIKGCTIENYPQGTYGIVYDPNFVTPPAGGYDTPANTFLPLGSLTVGTGS